MPKEFDACVSGGGRVRTIKVGKCHYRAVCFPRGRVKGRSVAGELHRKKSCK